MQFLGLMGNFGAFVSLGPTFFGSFGGICVILVYPGAIGNQFGAFWDVLEYFRLFQGILDYFGGIWGHLGDVLGHFGLFWGN